MANPRAGKSVALRVLEDLGYYCVDNLPVNLLNNFCRIGTRKQPKRYLWAVLIYVTYRRTQVSHRHARATRVNYKHRC
ncbi:hypothetical protein OH492_03345 [Vibrio chagasii]|nr:hypothetical protein [Vibrio chagasii]